MFSLDLSFSLFLLHLWDALPLSVLNICYFCVCRFLDFLFSLDLSSSLFFLYICGPHFLVRLQELLFLLLSLASFVIFVTFVGSPSLLSFKHLLFSFLLLDLLFSLDLSSSLFLLYLWGPISLSVFKNCYSCCCRLLHLLFSSVLNNCFVKLVSLAIACISGHPTHRLLNHRFFVLVHAYASESHQCTHCACACVP